MFWAGLFSLRVSESYRPTRPVESIGTLQMQEIPVTNRAAFAVALAGDRALGRGYFGSIAKAALGARLI